jgi:hypothetical protein
MGQRAQSLPQCCIRRTADRTASKKSCKSCSRCWKSAHDQLIFQMRHGQTCPHTGCPYTCRDVAPIPVCSAPPPYRWRRTGGALNIFCGCGCFCKVKYSSFFTPFFAQALTETFERATNHIGLLFSSKTFQRSQRPVLQIENDFGT